MLEQFALHIFGVGMQHQRPQDSAKPSVFQHQRGAILDLIGGQQSGRVQQQLLNQKESVKAKIINKGTNWRSMTGSWFLQVWPLSVGPEYDS